MLCFPWVLLAYRRSAIVFFYADRGDLVSIGKFGVGMLEAVAFGYRARAFPFCLPNGRVFLAFQYPFVEGHVPPSNVINLGLYVVIHVFVYVLVCRLAVDQGLLVLCDLPDASGLDLVAKDSFFVVVLAKDGERTRRRDRRRPRRVFSRYFRFIWFFIPVRLPRSSTIVVGEGSIKIYASTRLTFEPSRYPRFGVDGYDRPAPE